MAGLQLASCDPKSLGGFFYGLLSAAFPPLLLSFLFRGTRFSLMGQEDDMCSD